MTTLIIRVTRNNEKQATLSTVNLKASKKSKSSPVAPTTANALGYSKRRCSPRLRKIPVKVSQVSQDSPAPTSPVYDQEGRNVALLKEHPIDKIMQNSAAQSCRFLIKKSIEMHQEIERGLDNKLTLGPMGSLQYMARMIATSRNTLLSVHHLLLAESYRITVAEPNHLGTRIVSQDEFSRSLASSNTASS